MSNPSIILSKFVSPGPKRDVEIKSASFAFNRQFVAENSKLKKEDESWVLMNTYWHGDRDQTVWNLCRLGKILEHAAKADQDKAMMLADCRSNL